jgi:hypothetical protein
MRKLALSLLISLFLLNNLCWAQEVEKVKLGASYEIKKKQVINLRVTQVPKKYPWIEKELDGKTVNPEFDSVVVAENIEALEIKDEFGDKYTIPKGSKFFAKVKEIVPAKSFWRKEKVKLDFYALAVSDGSYDEYFEETSFQAYDGKNSVQPLDTAAEIQFNDDLKFDSRKDENLGDVLANIGRLGGYTLGGAIAGPIMLFSISSIVGAATTVAAFSNPYVVGGAAAIGGAVGLTAGIIRKGQDLKIEPGQKIKISLDNTWAITKLLDKELKNKSSLTAEKVNKNFVLDILKVKKARDDFGDTSLKILVYYKNKTQDDITYTSFKLVDSTGKAYEANVDDLSLEFYEGLPKEGTLQISFAVDYPNAPHQLKVFDQSHRYTLAYKEVILK